MVKDLIRRILLVLFLSAAAVNLFSLPAVAQEPQLLLILWHGMAWEDVKISPLYNGGMMALGTMNTRIGGGDPVSGAYLTIASGSRAFGVEGAAGMLHTDELIYGMRAADIYALRTGQQPSEPEIVNLKIASITGAFAQAKYPLEVGALADRLQAAGLKTAVFGNSDGKDGRTRWAALVGMDSSGKAASGLVGEELLINSSDYPHGMRTDYQRLFQAVVAADADLAVIDLGDPYRYTTYAGFLVPEQRETIRRRMVAEAWDFIQMLHNALPNAVLLIAAPYPSSERADSSQWLAPVVIVGKEPGLLSSGTTKWPGIVSNIDLAPTIVGLLSADSGVMLGRSIAVEAMDTKAAMAVIEVVEQKFFWINQYRSHVLRFLVGFQVILYLITLALLIIPKVLPHQFVRLVQLCLLISLSLPLVLLVLPQDWYWPAIVIVSLILLHSRYQNQLVSIMVVAAATAALIVVDVLRGSEWIRYSFLGYDPVGGARYYGLGNEYMGILIGSAIMGWALFRERMGKRARFTTVIDLVLFLAVTAVIAAPQWGTNVGGMIAAICGFGLAWLLAHTRLSWPVSVVVVGLAVAAALLGLMYFDGGRPEDMQSHIGTTTDLISVNGLEAAKEIIIRKLNMNLRLLRYSIWSRALLIAIAAMGTSLIWPSRYLQWLLRHHHDLVIGIAGTLTATIAALLFNDSGVVAAATCSFFAATTMLTLALSLKHNLLPAESHIQEDANR
ncbi:MAG: hypothetical protein GX177_05280 [Firmicutes bacterium]|nr:hypothetical protein [Bacillota bacterium]